MTGPRETQQTPHSSASPWFISMEQIWRLTQEAAPNVMDLGCSSKNKTLMLWQVKPTSLPIRWSDLHFWLMLGSKGTCPPASTVLGIGIILCKIYVARGRDTVPTDIMGVRVLTCHSEPDAWWGGFIWAHHMGTRLDTELHLHRFQAPTNPMCSACKSLFPGSKALILNPSSILGCPVFVGLCSREDRRPTGVCRVPAGFPIPVSHHVDLLTIYLTSQTPAMVIHLECGWRRPRPFGLVHEAESQLTAPEIEAIPILLPMESTAAGCPVWPFLQDSP